MSYCSRTFPEVNKKLLQYLQEPYFYRISGRLKYKLRNFDQDKYLLSLAMGSIWEPMIISLCCSCTFCFSFSFSFTEALKKTYLLWYFFSITYQQCQWAMSSISYFNNSNCVDIRKFEYSNKSSRNNFVFLLMLMFEKKSHITFLKRLAMLNITWSFDSAGRGYHFFRKYWTPYLSQRLDCYHEPNDAFNSLSLKWLWWKNTERKLFGIYPEKYQGLRSLC